MRRASQTVMTANTPTRGSHLQSSCQARPDAGASSTGRDRTQSRRPRRVRTFSTGSSAASPRPGGSGGDPRAPGASRPTRTPTAPPGYMRKAARSPGGPSHLPRVRSTVGPPPSRCSPQLQPSRQHPWGPRSTTTSRRPFDRLTVVTSEPPTRSARIARQRPAARALRVATRWPPATLAPGHRRATGPVIGSVTLPRPWPHFGRTATDSGPPDRSRFARLARVSATRTTGSGPRRRS